MSSSLLTPPSDRWSASDDRPATPNDTTGRRRGRGGGPARLLAVLLVTSALLGGATTAGILVATGATGNGTTTTTTIRRTSSAGGGLDASALYASAAPGVVDITAKSSSTASAPTPFGGTPQQSETTATGTGFVVDASGHIVTAAHVVDGASSISVKLQDGTTRTATVLGKDDATDIAVLKVDASGLTLHPLTLGSSSAIDVGDAGRGRSATRSATPAASAPASSPAWTGRSRRPNGFTVAHAIQTDAAVNPGNSGGPCSTRTATSSGSSTRSPPTAAPSRAPASASPCRSTSSSRR